MGERRKNIYFVWRIVSNMKISILGNVLTCDYPDGSYKAIWVKHVTLLNVLVGVLKIWIRK